MFLLYWFKVWFKLELFIFNNWLIIFMNCFKNINYCYKIKNINMIYGIFWYNKFIRKMVKNRCIYLILINCRWKECKSVFFYFFVVNLNK